MYKTPSYKSGHVLNEPSLYCFTIIMFMHWLYLSHVEAIAHEPVFVLFLNHDVIHLHFTLMVATQWCQKPAKWQTFKPVSFLKPFNPTYYCNFFLWAGFIQAGKRKQATILQPRFSDNMFNKLTHRCNCMSSIRKYLH